MTEKNGLLYGAIIAGLIFVGTLTVYNVSVTPSVTGEDIAFVLSIVFGAIAGIVYIQHTLRKTHLFHPTERGFVSGLAVVYFFLTTFGLSSLQFVTAYAQNFF